MEGVVTTMEPIDYFNTLDILEPKCSGCGSKVEYGITTTFDDARETHVCNKCGKALG
ncbi:MAG TPA: zinc ribbon domain-containing protein [Candidatus Nanoarchaeia archaeon]|nr:zinc ribbon domain-containing protein [Candidatus Nanoarchaeia archaeon]